MKLFLCEKPSQAKDIAAVLGSPKRMGTYIETAGGVVTWAIGHLLELSSPEAYGPQYAKWNITDLPILPATFIMVPKLSTKAQLKGVMDLLKKATEVVIATDADKEGEMIARELLNHCKYRGRITRLWLSALDPASVRKALDRIKPGHETESLYAAALARSRADWLVGMNMTRAATVLYRRPGETKAISIGRVQTPTLALVVRRDRAIECFKARDYFEIAADVSTTAGSILLRYAPREDERLFDRGKAEEIATNAKGVEGKLKVEQETKKKAPPALFSLGAFQARANALWGWTIDKGLEVAQSLYETHKATTYPRSDCSNLPEEQIGDVPTIVSNLMRLEDFANAPIPDPPIIRKSVFDTSKVTAHHAIIPTMVQADLSAMSPDERKGYFLIARSYLAVLMPDYEYEQTRISLGAADVIFLVLGNVPKRLGWRALYTTDGSSDDKGTPELPSLPDGTIGRIEATKIEGKRTDPPSRYTEGTLLLDMKTIGKFVADPEKKARLKETSGIGTEATRGNIIKTIRDREFVQTKGKQIISTSKGRDLIALLEKHLPPLADPGETAVWEAGMEAIVNGTTSCDSFTAEVSARVTEYIGILNGAAPAQSAPTDREYGGKPICDGGDRWLFQAVAGNFKKELSGRQMTIDDYIAVFAAPPETLPSFNGFVSGRTKGEFSARLRYSPDRVFKGSPAPGVDFVF